MDQALYKSDNNDNDTIVETVPFFINSEDNRETECQAE